MQIYLYTYLYQFKDWSMPYTAFSLQAGQVQEMPQWYTGSWSWITQGKMFLQAEFGRSRL